MLLLQQMVVLFLLMGVGYLCARRGVLNEEASKKISMIVVNVANPALILSGGMAEEKISGQELLQTLGIIIAVYAVLLVIAQLLPHLLRVEEKSRGAYKVMTIFSNIGFMGFPVIAALYGNGALLYGSLFIIPYNILIYTYGISAIQSQGKKSDWRQSLTPARVLNIGVIACVVSMAIYLLGIPVPEVIKTTVTQLSNLTAPLSMMVIGASLTGLNLKALFCDVRLLVFSAIKLIAIPILGVLIIRQFIANPVICGVCMVMLATPVGSMTAMLAQQYDGDYEMTTKGVALTTILSVATMPLVEMLLFAL